MPNNTILIQTCNLPLEQEGIRNTIIELFKIQFPQILSFFGIVLFFALVFGIISKNFTEPNYWIFMFILFFIAIPTAFVVYWIWIFG